MMRFLKKFLFNTGEGSSVPTLPKPDIPATMQAVKKKEKAADIPLGRRIHQLEYGSLEVRLDRDITERYRITVYQGPEREFSFTVFGKKGDYDTLEKSFNRVFEFLESDRSISNLPDDDLLKGFHYGNSG